MSGLTKQVSVVYAVDKNYLLPLTVSVLSLIENFASHRNLKIFILHNGVSEEAFKPVRSTLLPKLRQGIDLVFLEYDSALLKKLPTTLHFSHSNYARLLTPSLVPEDLEKLLYLDADTLILSDVSALFDLDVSPWASMLAPDWTGKIHHPLQQFPSDLSSWEIPDDAPYFNTGVQLMNLRRWREEKISEHLLETARARPDLLFLADQNLFNICLYGKIGRLDPKWNKQFIYKKIREGEWKMPYQIHSWDPPHLIHFVSEEKPWLPGCTLPEKDLYYSYWKKTQFPFNQP